MELSAITAANQSQPEARERTASVQGDCPNLSVVILTYNEEVNLPECLNSIRFLNCHVFVVDSGSNDRTVEIAKESGAGIRYHPFDNYSLQRNWALANMPFDTPWVLHLDADERLTPELVAEINSVMARPNIDADGFLLRKRTIFMGRWIRHGGHYPSYHLRLFRTGRGRCEDRLYDQHFIVDGPIKPLQNDYMDIVASDISSWSLRHVRWAAMEAKEMAVTDDRTGQVAPDVMGNPIERKRWWRKSYGHWPPFARAFIYWVYRYFVRLGFLDGKEGLIFHYLQGFWFRFLVDALMCERERNQMIGSLK